MTGDNPAGEQGGKREWQPEVIDQAADASSAEEAFTLRIWCNMKLGISAAQRIRTLHEAVWVAIDD